MNSSDVWTSGDGLLWELVTDVAPWSSWGFSAIAHHERIWELGGGLGDSPFMAVNEVWNSKDGLDWTLLTNEMEWPGRGFHTSLVYDDKIWVLGGLEGFGDPHICYNDVWYVEYPSEADPSISLLMPNSGSVSGGTVVSIEGNNLTAVNDVVFGSTRAASFTVNTTSHITAVSPPASSEGVVNVRVSGFEGSTNPLVFNYTLAPQTGSLQVTIAPQGAINDGAQWRRIGTSTWRDSGTTESNVSTGPHTIEFKSIPNWNNPANIPVTINDNQTTAVTGTYTLVPQAGVLRVDIEPSGAREAGARWRVYDQSKWISNWMASRSVVQGLTAATDMYTVEFEARPGWVEPISKIVSIYANEVTSYTGVYEPVPCTDSCNPACENYSFAACCEINPCHSPSCPNYDPRICSKSFLKFLPLSTYEEVLPLDLEASPNTVISSWQPIAIRLAVGDEVDPETVWCTVEGDLGYAAVGGDWLPSYSPSNRDGWIVFTPTEAYQDGEYLTVTAGAMKLDGSEIEPVSYNFIVSADAVIQPLETFVIEELAAPLIDVDISTQLTPAYRVGPVGVYSEPTAVQIPVPEGYTADDLTVYYYSESERHEGWFPADRVLGLVVPKSQQTVLINGQQFVEVTINHSAVLALGVPSEVSVASLGPVNIGARGSSMSWVSFVGILFFLSVILGALVQANGRRVSGAKRGPRG